VSARAEHAGDGRDLEQNHHLSAELAPDSAQSGEQDQFKTGDLYTDHPTKSRLSVLCRVICERNDGLVAVIGEHDSRLYRVPRKCLEIVRDENKIPSERYRPPPPISPLAPGLAPVNGALLATIGKTSSHYGHTV
jgi:hypothetical protein